MKLSLADFFSSPSPNRSSVFVEKLPQFSTAGRRNRTECLNGWCPQSWLLCAAFAALTVSHVYAATFYAATTGSDANNGTSITTPWLTIGYASSRLAAGDT